MAVALIVVGPDKLPEMAKTIAKQLIELKKAAGAFKETIQDEVKKEGWDNIEPQGALPENLLPGPKEQGVNENPYFEEAHPATVSSLEERDDEAATSQAPEKPQGSDPTPG